MNKKLKIRSTYLPEKRENHPTINAINNADRRRAFNCFNEELLNRILDIKNNK